jgi:hypothetical protein
MATETFPSGATQQPENNRGFAHNMEGAERDHLVNYSEQEEYLGRDATLVAVEVFGLDLRKPGMFFTEAGSDLDVPYRVECHGDGHIVTFNLYHSDIYGGREAGRRGLDGCVVSADVAQYMATA